MRARIPGITSRRRTIPSSSALRLENMRKEVARRRREARVAQWKRGRYVPPSLSHVPNVPGHRPRAFFLEVLLHEVEVAPHRLAPRLAAALRLEVAGVPALERRGRISD